MDNKILVIIVLSVAFLLVLFLFVFSSTEIVVNEIGNVFLVVGSLLASSLLLNKYVFKGDSDARKHRNELKKVEIEFENLWREKEKLEDELCSEYSNFEKYCEKKKDIDSLKIKLEIQWEELKSIRQKYNEVYKTDKIIRFLVSTAIAAMVLSYIISAACYIPTLGRIITENDNTAITEPEDTTTSESSNTTAPPEITTEPPNTTAPSSTTKPPQITNKPATPPPHDCDKDRCPVCYEFYNQQ